MESSIFACLALSTEMLPAQDARVIIAIQTSRNKFFILCISKLIKIRGVYAQKSPEILPGSIFNRLIMPPEL